jgi:hypothetical protein
MLCSRQDPILALVFDLCTSAEGIEDLLLKTLAFLSSQISQVIKMTVERRSLGTAVGDLEMACQ